MKRTRSRIEKDGPYGTCEVAGWRYEGYSVWCVKVWAENRDVRRNTYKVMSGMFEPEATSRAEQEAVLYGLATASRAASRPKTTDALAGRLFSRFAMGQPSDCSPVKRPS
jgi:hypothetical protein